MDDDATSNGVRGATAVAPSLLGADFLREVLSDIDAAPGTELLSRSRALLTRTQRERAGGQRAGIAAVDALLAEARHRREPALVGALLRHAVVIRLVSNLPPAEADPLLDRLAAHAEQHGMTVLLASAHALRARRSVLGGTEETALTDAATAMALLSVAVEAGNTPEPGSDRDADRLLGEVLGELGLALVQLGAHEPADDLLAESGQRLARSAGTVEQLVNGLNRVRLLLSWGLRLERAGHDDQAVIRFQDAAGMARTTGPLWTAAMVGVATGPGEPADQCAVLGASEALASPDVRHVARLRRLEDTANFTADRIVVGVALARCRERAGQVHDALAGLDGVRRRLGRDGREPMLELALSREQARLQEILLVSDRAATTREADDTGRSAIKDYASALEAEMWSMRQARIAAMRSQAEHLRLAREHGAVAAQALTDPLTGLPNRRALDERLASALAVGGPSPCTVALIDLDRFKQVNDERSHSVGDDVLRAVAVAVRGALRGEDTVARYGGDEFVVVLPATPLPAARSALNRAVRAVAGLHPDEGGGVTLSVGVVEVTDGDRPHGAADVLSRADTAMYRAKRRGGNRVNDGG